MAVRHDKKSGGGLLTYCRLPLDLQPLPLPTSTFVEWIGATLHMNGISIININLYAPPLPVPSQTILNELETLLSHISTLDKPVIITGDFNLPGIRWVYDQEIDGLMPNISLQTSPQEFELIQLFFSNNFIQINPEVNSLGKHLDLIFASPILSPAHLVLPPLQYLFKNSVHHEPITASIQVSHSETQPVKPTPSYFPPDTHMAILRSISDIECNGNCVGTFTENLNSVDASLKRALSIFRANKRPPLPNPFPTWFKPTTTLLLLRKRVDKFRRQSKHLASPSPLYLAARRDYSILKNTELSEARKKVAGLEENKSQFFKYIQSYKKAKVTLPSKLYDDTTTLTGYNEISDALCRQFASISVTNTPLYNPRIVYDSNFLPNHNDLWLTQRIIMPADILKELLSLDPNCDPGAMGLPNTILRTADINFATWLALCFNKCIAIGAIQEDWLHSYISPIPKISRPTDISHFRPITIASTIPKLLDKCVTQFLLFSIAPLLSPEQHGFLPNRSISTNHFVFSSFLHCAIAENLQVDCISFDLSKAFDTLPHEIILQHLANFSTPYEIYFIIHLFLSKRTIAIKTPDGISEASFKPNCGVPQGSHMGPVLFVIFMNGLFALLKEVEVLAYADDVKIFKIIRSQADHLALQTAINTFSDWATMNKLTINPSKSQHISFHKTHSNRLPTRFSLNGTQIPLVSSLKDLGVIFDENLSFNQHLAKLTTQFSQTVGFSSRWIRSLNSTACSKAFFLSYLLPILEYDLVSWANDSLGFRDSFESFQQRFTRYILKIPPDPRSPNYRRYKTRLGELDLTPLFNRRLISMIMLMVKFLKGVFTIHAFQKYLPVNQSTQVVRRPHTFVIPPARNNILSKSPHIQCAVAFNKYQYVFNLNDNINTIKTNLKIYFKNFEVPREPF